MDIRQDAPSHSAFDAYADARGSREPDLHGNGARPRRGGVREKFAEQPVLNTLLLALCIAAIVFAITAIGPSSSSSGQATRTTTVKSGVVQSTVSGSGNIESADQLNLGFKTAGTVTHIYVKAGQHVTQGQLLATLDPQSAEVTLQQSRASLQSAEANLAKEEEDEGETGQGASGATATAASGATATAASTSDVAYTAYAAASPPAQTSTQPVASTPGAGSPTTTTGSSTTPASSAPTGTATKPTSKSAPTAPKSSRRSSSSKRSAKTTEASSSAPGETASQGTGSTTKQSAATREANLASAKAAVKSDKLTVQNDEQAVQNTKLYAPESGTIVSLSGEVGETVSGTGTTRAASSSSSAGSSSSSGAAGTGGGGLGGSSASGSSSSSSQGSSGSSSSFAVLSDLESLQLVVALSESEIGSVHVGQIASVTIEALGGRKVAAHVVSVSQLPTSSSGAVSYDVTFQLDQTEAGLKVGMSATAEVVVSQAEGVNVPTSAIKDGTVTVVHNGKQETRRITTGLAGDSSTIVLSGLRVGEEVVLPTATGSKSSLSSRLGSRITRGGGLGGALGGGGFVGGGGFPAGGPPGG